MTAVFCVFAGLLVLLSLHSLRGGIRFFSYCRRSVNSEPPANTPFVSVIVPCRGLEDGLSGNLSSLFRFDYPEYEIVFVIDDAADPARSTIENLMAAGDRPARLVVAEKAISSSQKVENLREAVLHISERSMAFVFYDSDARPPSGSLRHLVAALHDEKVGAATGYRWFLSKRPTLATELRSAWNASIASALGPNTHSNFCWGGSMAIRRDTFDRLGIRDSWAGTLSDDFAVTRAIKAAGLDIAFVPKALTATFGRCTFAELLEFTTRQMKITRTYARGLWLLSFFGSALFCAVMLAAIVLLFTAKPLGLTFNAASATLFAISICSTAKAWLRLKAVSFVLTDHRDAVERQFWSQNTLWALTPAVFLYNSIAAAISRRITWRGTSYILKSPTETVIIAD